MQVHALQVEMQLREERLQRIDGALRLLVIEVQAHIDVRTGKRVGAHIPSEYAWIEISAGSPLWRHLQPDAAERLDRGLVDENEGGTAAAAAHVGVTLGPDAHALPWCDAERATRRAVPRLQVGRVAI